MTNIPNNRIEIHPVPIVTAESTPKNIKLPTNKASFWVAATGGRVVSKSTIDISSPLCMQ